MTQNAKQKLKWERISRTIPMAADTIRLNQDKVHWPNIFRYQLDLHPDFYREFRDKIVEHNAWSIVCRHGNIDQQFIYDERASLDWDVLLENKVLSDRSRFDEYGLIEIISGSVISVSKTEVDLTGLSPTTVTIYGSTIAGHNATHTIAQITETSDTYDVDVSSLPPWGPGEFYGFLRFNDTGTSVDGLSFLTQADIEPYLHVDNDPSGPFRPAFIKGQFLPYQFIIDNESSLNMTTVSESQDLHEGFIMVYATESTLAGGSPTLSFDWNKITINIDMKHLLESPNFSWVDPLINYQLLNRWNNLTRDFIFANYSKLPIPDIGIQRSLTSDDIQQLQSLASVIETATRRDSVKFEYPRGEILSDLREAGFQFDGEIPVGYVYYRDNGSVKPNNKFDFSTPGTVSVPHVNLDQFLRSGVGILVRNGDTLIDDIIENGTVNSRVAKVRIPIVSRNIGQRATGSISMSGKTNFTQSDRLYIHDGDTRHGLEFRLDGATAKASLTLSNAYTVESDPAENTINLDDQPFILGDRLEFTGSVPTPFQTGVTYYVIPVNADQFRVALSPSDAVNGVPITITGTSNFTVNRLDSSFTLGGNDQTYYNVRTGMEVRVSGSHPTLLDTSETYFVILNSDGTIRLALTLEDAKSNRFIQFIEPSEWSLSFTGMGTSLPVDIESTSLANGQQMAGVLDRILNRLYKMTITDSASLDEQTWFPTIKTGAVENTVAFVDYSSTGTFEPINNRFSIQTDMLLEEGDPITLRTTGSLPPELSVDTVYYVHKLSNFELEVCATYEDAISSIPIGVSSPGSGTHTAYALRVDLGENIGLHTGNKISLTGLDIPDGLSTGTDYFVRMITDTRLEFYDTYSNALSGDPIIIRKTGDNVKSIVANDVNLVSTSGNGIVRFIDGNDIYVELISGQFNDGDAVNGETISSVERLISVNSVISGSVLNLTSDLDVTRYSDGNKNIEHSFTIPSAISFSGMIGGFEEIISDANARGVGVVIPEHGILRAFSVDVIDPDYRDKVVY